ncbi:Apolipoprotein N-acyltransferase [Planctomycetes bacterium K2D]|uniref:Apolipoprotein N-acyltransferase n=1 Tax=Botrimarina mediterranea TaxID=2528022 RepID=A0A518KF16_9BACT|nr:Apolipoprotein N-acyltransferase [Botrimarina mediterranea]QDV80982.1 Apolipoprotein N-acyltransferase [Planctomycetes bacterium K2D]
MVEFGPPRVLLVGVIGAVLLWLAQPPAALWPLAWIAPGVWLWLAESPAEWRRREYLKMWLAGSLYWLLAVHWVRLPHPLTPLGWAPLALYLGLYPVALVALVRTARRRWRWPLWLAAPVVWTGLELLQARLFTGFLMGAVSHSQAGQPWIRSLAAYAGAYGVTFAVVLVAATLANAFLAWKTPRRGRRLIEAIASIAIVIAVGFAARSAVETNFKIDKAPRPRVALIQGDIRATWDPDPARGQRIMDRHMVLSREAFAQSRRDGRPVDLVIWPESMFRTPLIYFDGAAEPPADADDAYTARIENTASWLKVLADMTGGAASLVGIDRFDILSEPAGVGDERVYNSVLLSDGEGQPIAVYDKTHLVPFGEYIPFASGMPIIYYLTPISGGMGVGAGPVAMDAPLRDGPLGNGGVLRLCPSICYETVVPHVIRRQVATLTADGERPDVLVNVTNDAWFWGSSELDMHLACGVYRAVENGLPLLVAANGGLSAVIDATGEVQALGPRMAEQALVADVPRPSARATFYSRWGDVFAGVCLAACGLLAGSRGVEAIKLRRAASRGR